MIKFHFKENCPISFTQGDLAPRSQSAVTVRCGEMVILVVANLAASEKHTPLNLQVHYGEKFYAFRRIPGSFTRREGKPRTQEILMARLIDRALRPFLHPYTSADLQLGIQVISYDPSIDCLECLSILGACAALRSLGIDCKIGGIKLSLISGVWQVNPSLSQREEAECTVLLASTGNGVAMLEMESQALDVTTDQILSGLEQGISLLRETLSYFDAWDLGSSDYLVKLQVSDKVNTWIDQHQKQIKKNWRCEEYITDLLQNEEGDMREDLEGPVKSLIRSCHRDSLLAGDMRYDGRAHDEIRKLTSSLNTLPSAHGSALFQRGNTQALASVTLGGDTESQLVESIEGPYRDHFMFHYNFPPFCVGEVGNFGWIKRREIGHGALAKKSIAPVLPKSIPALRVTTDILSADGSTSMASVCSASLALANAGVDLAAPVAGIAMGIIWNLDRKYIVLSDICALEDGISDCDLKLAGTSKGVISLQLDTHRGCLPLHLLKRGLEYGRNGIASILKHMHGTLQENDRSSYAPHVKTLNVQSGDIKFIIGKGGAQIKKICEVSGCKIDLDDKKLTVTITGDSESSVLRAEEMILECSISPQQVMQGKVSKILSWGCWVNLQGSRVGFLPLQDIRDHKLKVGSTVQVKVDAIQKNKVTLKIV